MLLISQVSISKIEVGTFKFGDLHYMDSDLRLPTAMLLMGQFVIRFNLTIRHGFNCQLTIYTYLIFITSTFSIMRALESLLLKSPILTAILFSYGIFTQKYLF